MLTWITTAYYITSVLSFRFLFGLIEKNKHMETLVDRFCAKYNLVDDEYKCRNITFCLTLISYNERGLKRLLDNFDLYKHQLHFKDVDSMMRQILTNANKLNKNEIKVSNCCNIYFK